MFLDGLTSVDRLQELRPNFGIYTVRIEKLTTEQRRTVIYSPDETLQEGIAHVAVSGVNRRVAEWIAREVAERVKPPAAAVLNLLEDAPDSLS